MLVEKDCCLRRRKTRSCYCFRRTMQWCKKKVMFQQNYLRISSRAGGIYKFLRILIYFKNWFILIIYFYYCAVTYTSITHPWTYIWIYFRVCHVSFRKNQPLFLTNYLSTGICNRITMINKHKHKEQTQTKLWNYRSVYFLPTIPVPVFFLNLFASGSIVFLVHFSSFCFPTFRGSFNKVC